MKKQLLILAVGVIFFGSINLIFAQTNPTPKPAQSSPTLLGCLWTAVDKREKAVSAAFSEKTTTIAAALDKRTASLKQAWSMSDNKERNSLIRSTWNAFKVSVAQAKKVHRGKVQAAWKTFNQERKPCGLIEISGESAGSDNDL